MWLPFNKTALTVAANHTILRLTSDPGRLISTTRQELHLNNNRAIPHQHGLVKTLAPQRLCVPWRPQVISIQWSLKEGIGPLGPDPQAMKTGCAPV